MLAYRFRRMFSIGLAAALIFSLSLTAAADENYSVEIKNTDPQYNEYDNLIHGKTPADVKWDDGSDAADVDSGVRGRWTDGGFVKGGDGDNQIQMREHQSLRIAYDLENKTDISGVIFAGTDNGYADDYVSVDGCWNKGIRIFVGDDINNLFENAQKVNDIDNTSGSESWRRVFDITYNDGKHPKGRYIGFEVVKYNSYPIFIEELIVFGKTSGGAETAKAYTVTAEKKSETDIKQAISDSHAKNILAGKDVTAVNSTDGNTWSQNCTPSGLTNGQADFPVNVGENTAPAPRFIFDMESKHKISDILLFAHWGTSGLKHREYTVSVADSKEKLFTSDETARLSYLNSSADVDVIHFNYADETKRPEGRYIGIEIHGNSDNGGGNIQMQEIAVYGENTELESEKDYTVTAEKKSETDIKQAISDSHAKNILAGKDVTAVNSTDGNTWSQNCTPSGLTNGQADFPVNVGENTAPAPRFIFDMESKHKISDILLFAHWGTSGLKHREYTVSVADSKEKLFTSDETARLSYLNSSADVDVIHFNYADETKRPEGRYIGIEIHGNSDNGGGNIQMQEIAVYGENTELESEKDYTVTAEKIVDDDILGEKVKASYADNILADKPAKATKASDNTAWTAGHNSMEWTDGRYNFPINVGTDGLDSPLRFAFDAKEEYEISKLMLFAHSGASGLNHSKYTISIADSRSELFTDKANKTIVYKNPGNLNVFTFEYKKDAEKPKGRWIGIEIHGNSAEGGNIQMREIAVYGAKTGAPAIDDPSDNFEYYENYTVQINGLTTNDVSAKAAENLLLGLEPTLTNDAGFEGKFLNGNYWNLVDGAIYQEGHIDYASPNSDNEPMRFTYDLLQTVPIDQFLIVHYYYRKGNINFSSNEYELYVSNDKSTLYNAENRVFNYVNANNYDPGVPYSGTQQLFTFTKDKPVGRYVGVRMVNLSAADNTGRLDQLAIYSEGKLPVDAAAAQTFEDKDTGIKVSVLRKRADDLFDLASSLRVTKRALSSEEQVAADSVHFKLLGSAYQLELLDKSGNVLNDAALGGRIIKIELPMPDKDGANNKRLCCIADGKLEQLPYTIFDEEYAVAFLRGSLGTLAIFQDTLKDMAVGGAADVNLSDGMSGIGDGGSNNNAGAVPTGVAASMLILLPPAALAVLGISRKRRGTGGNKK